MILIVVIALLPIGALSVVQALGSLEYSRNLISNRLIMSAQATAGQEKDTFMIAKQILESLSRNTDVQSMGPECQPTLKTGLAGTAAISNFVRIDANGRVRCSALAYETPLSLATVPWWQDGMAQKDFSFSAPVDDAISKRKVLMGMLPMVNSAGKSVGAVIVAIKIDWIQDSLDMARTDKNVVIFLADQNGRNVLTKTDVQLPIIAAKIAHGKIQESSARYGKIWMYSSAPLFEDKLYIVHAELKNTVMASALKQVRIDLILPIITIMLASLALWFGTNRLIIRWLHDLSGLAAQFAQGNYTGNPDMCKKAPKELGVLCDDLHIMANAVSTRNRELQDALSAKTLLTLDIHHRVKNNLQIVSSLLSLQSRQITDVTAKSALQQTQARIGTLAQLHQLLYDDYNGDARGQIDIVILFSRVCAQLRTLNDHQKNITLHCNPKPFLISVEKALPLSLFVVEALTNIYRHAFPMDRIGTAHVDYCVQGNDACLTVRDDGVGYDVGNPVSSMGHQLMAGLAMQLCGTMYIEPNITGGMCITLRHPV